MQDLFLILKRIYVTELIRFPGADYLLLGALS